MTTIYQTSRKSLFYAVCKELKKLVSCEVKNDIKDNVQHTKPYNYNKIIINVIMFLFDQTKAVIMIKSNKF